MGDQIFMVTSGKAGGPVKFSRSKIVRDIVIKTDELTMEKWAASLAQHMATEAENSEATRSALNRILGLG